MKNILIDNHLVSYHDQGKGPALVCIHGWQSDAASFATLAEALPHYRVIALDLPNFGRSDDAPAIVSLDDYSHLIGAFVTKLGLKQYALAGHSLGGQISIYAVARGILIPKKLVLIAASGVRDQKKGRRNLLRLLSKPMKKLVPSTLKDIFYSRIGSDYRSKLSPIHKDIIAQALNTDVQADAQSVSTPTLLLYGSADGSTPAEFGQTLHEAIKDSRLEIIEDGDHWLQTTSTEAVATHIDEFLGGSRA